MERKDLVLEIAKHISEPISAEQPTPVFANDISDVEIVDAGERVYTYDYDTDADEVLDVNWGAASGDTIGCWINPVKRSPVGDTQLTFKGLNSNLTRLMIY